MSTMPGGSLGFINTHESLALFTRRLWKEKVMGGNGGGEEMIRPGLDDLRRLEAAGTARMDATLLASHLS